MSEEIRLGYAGRVVIYGNEEGKLKRGKNGKWRPAGWILAGLSKTEAKRVRTAAKQAKLYKILTASGRPPSKEL